MAPERVFLGIALVILGASVMTRRGTDSLLDSERRYGSARQQLAADTPRRRAEVQAFSAVVGGTFIATGVLTAVTNHRPIGYLVLAVSGLLAVSAWVWLRRTTSGR